MVVQKDLYEILQLFPGSSTEEIRRAYRRLALQFHPDKNPGDQEATDRFREILKAYTLLSNEKLRYAYDRENGYLRAAGSPPPSPAVLLQEAERLQRFMSQLNPEAIDHTALKFQLDKLLSPGHLRIMKERSANAEKLEFIMQILRSAEFLPYREFQSLTFLLKDIVAGDIPLNASLDRKKKLRFQKHLWNKFSPLLVLLITLALCLLIFFLSDLN